MVDYNMLERIDANVADRYSESLRRHIAYVQDAGRLLGVPDHQLAVHDDSKWSCWEFAAYAQNFEGGGDPIRFPFAWLHHMHNNEHHWQYWLFPDGWVMEQSTMEKGIIEMPENYVLEMVADWMGASMSYTGSWDMTKWLDNNLSKVVLHTRSRITLNNILQYLGYNI